MLNININLKLYLVVLLLCTAKFLFHTEAKQNDEKVEHNEKFLELISRAGPSKRVHLVSEIVQAGQKIQVEEFLDLSTYNQLISFKWNSYDSKQEANEPLDRQFKIKRMSLLILNDQDSAVMYQYEPYKCAIFNLDDDKSHYDGIDDWKKFIIDAGEKQIGIGQLINSIRSNAPNSPYLTKIPNNEEKFKYILGVSGLWLKATYPDDKSEAIIVKHPSHLDRQTGKEVVDSVAWRLELADSGFSINYYQESSSLKISDPDGLSNINLVDTLNMIEISNFTTNQAIQLINVIEAGFDFTDRLARDIFTLPIGFDCPEINKRILSLGDRSYFQQKPASQVSDIEIITTKFNEITLGQLAIYSEIDVKNIQFAEAKHPLNPDSSLILYHIRDDGLKFIDDLEMNLRFQIPSSVSKQPCSIGHLNYGHIVVDSENQESFYDDDPIIKEANVDSVYDFIEISFENGIIIPLGPQLMDYILYPGDNELKRMKLLNQIEISSTKYELIYESQVSATYKNLIKLNMSSSTNSFLVEKMVTIIRVYEQEFDTKSESISHSSRNPRGPIRLTRAMWLIFDRKKEKKLAEIRWNLSKKIEGLSFTKKAHLFDITRCRNVEDESMELIVTYPIEAKKFSSISENFHKLIEQFYISNQQADNNSDENNDKKDQANKIMGDDHSRPSILYIEQEKSNIARSLNFLRLPRIKLSFGAKNNQLELRLTLFDKLSPLYQFTELKRCTFESEDEKEYETLLVGSLVECAQFCQQLDCKLFAYDGNHECKLSSRPLGCFMTPLDKLGTRDEVELLKSGFKIVLKAESVLFYDSHFDIKTNHEASLAEIYSFLQHDATDQLSEFNDENINVGDGEATTQLDNLGRDNGVFDNADHTTNPVRNRRQTSERMKPIMSFNFVDFPSMKANEHTPPKTRTLVPSSIRPLRLPVYLDVHSDRALAKQVAESFKGQQVGKCYQLTILDNIEPAMDGLTQVDEKSFTKPTSGNNANERTFIDNKHGYYYTMKKIDSIEQDNCALLCYNSIEWDSKTSTDQTCISFSYQIYAQECVLLVRTAFKFCDLTDLVNEGDIVHEIESLDDILIDYPLSNGVKDDYNNDDDDYDIDNKPPLSKGCILAKRNYLPEFQGPIMLAPEYCARETTRSIEKQFDGSMKWLKIYELESSGPHSVDREVCPQKCIDKAHLGTQKCFAFDYCSSVYLDSRGFRKYKVSCNLLLIETNPQKVGVSSQTYAEHIKQLRNYLAGVTLSQPTNQSEKSPEQVESQPIKTIKSYCERYILPHLREFNHLQQRQVDSYLLEKLAQPGNSSDKNVNLDTCAMDCYLKSTRSCLGFQFCMSTRQDSSSSVMENSNTLNANPQPKLRRSCILFNGYSSSLLELSSETRVKVASNEMAPSGSSITNEVKQSATIVGNKNKLRTGYNRNCNVYLRQQFQSLDDVVNFIQISPSSPLFDDRVQYQEPIDIEFHDWSLVGWFSLAYLFVCICFGIYLKKYTNICAISLIMSS